MRFARLLLKAYGPFTGRALEFARRGASDLHLVYGPNEAGKSSTLRAVRGLLFGVPERTPDNFLHDFGDLRVGAELELSNGERLGLMRRKGRKQTLFPLDLASGAELTTTPFDEERLARLLGGLDEPLYDSLFGLDLAGMAQGGRDLEEGRGEIGRALFRAATGLGDLHGLLASLDQAAGESFKARASTTRLNRALREFDEQRKRLREVTVRSSAWDAAEGAHREAEARHAALAREAAEARARLQHLERLRGNLPLLAERALLLEELAALRAVPDLSPEAGQARVAAQTLLTAAGEQQAAAQAAIDAQTAALDGLAPRADLLAQAAAIESAFHGLPGWRAASEAAPVVARRRAALEADIAELLVALEAPVTPDAAGEILPSAVQRARVSALIEEGAALRQREQVLASSLAERRVAAARLQADLAALPGTAPPDALELALGRVAGVVELEARVRGQARQLADLVQLRDDELRSLWSDTLESLLAMTPPLAANADAFEAEFASLAQDERLQAEQAQVLVRDLAGVTRELETLAASGEVVTQVEVGAARTARDRLWEEVATELAAPRAAPAGLAAAFEAALREADRRADLLRADTVRATRVADARQRIAAMEAAQAEAALRAATLATRRSELETRWRTLVAPLGRAELNPAGLRDWLARRERIAARAAEVTRLRAQQEEDQAEWRQVCAALADLLTLCGLPAETRAAEGLAQARAAVAAARRTASEREALTRQRVASEAELARLAAEQALCVAERDDWRARWAEAMRVLRLREDAEAAEAQVRLDQFAALADMLAQRGRLAEEAAGHADTLTGFATQVASLRETLAAAPGGEPASVAEQLYAALGAARQSEARRAELQATLESERGRRLEATREAETARARLAALCREAGVESVAELAAMESSAARKRAARQRLSDLERDLVTRNGRSLQAVVDEAEGEQPEALDARLAELAAAQDGLEAAVVVAQERAFEARRALDAIDGGSVAAEAQQALGALAARIAGEARGYARLRLAHALLARVIQRYRERHQGPLLARAAALFARITVGSFAGLVVDWDDDGQRLLCERPGGERVPVAGLSQGTRDQLYLALRIAAVEQHLASRGPLPVIVDDLLAQFDDDRALATLEVLAELATRTQVLCFSHHRHLLTLVEGSPLAARVGVQNL